MIIPVRVGAGITLVRVADDVFLRGRRSENSLPFDAGRERRAAPAAQAGRGDARHDGFGGHAKRILKTAITAVVPIVFEAARVGDAQRARTSNALVV